jgi:IS5 family transposase
MKRHYRLYFHWRKANRPKVADRYKRKICTNLGRLIRDIERKISGNSSHQGYFENLLELGKHFIVQAKGELASNSEKIYSPHEPQVECIAKGKAHKKYEFGNKVSFVSTDRNNFIVGCVSHQERPHDSKTLSLAISNVEKITGQKPQKYCSVDLGYRGHGINKKELFVIHPALKELTPDQKKLVKRRGKSESIISYVKRNCRLGINYLKGVVGDAINVISSAVAYNVRLLMRNLELKYT